MFVPTTQRKWLIDTIDRFDLKKITVHGFRRTFATLAFETGATIKEVQSQLGHKNNKTTMDIYTEVNFKAKKKKLPKSLPAMCRFRHRTKSRTILQFQALKPLI